MPKSLLMNFPLAMNLIGIWDSFLQQKNVICKQYNIMKNLCL
jgi:hypothetical protein